MGIIPPKSVKGARHKKAEMVDKWLKFDKGKLVVNCSFKYESGMGHTAAAVAIIPLE